MTSTPDIRLLLSDVDGTLVRKDKSLADSTIDAVRRLRAAGIAFAVTSSRPLFGMRMLIEPLRIDTLLGGFNGGLIATPDFTPIQTRAIDAAAVDQALGIIAQFGIDAWLFTSDTWYTQKLDAPHVAHETHTIETKPVIVDAFTAEMKASAIKLVAVSDDYPKVADCETAVQAALGATVSATRSQAYYLDITHPLANKGEVVKAVAERFNLRTDQIATIGDGHNDVLMFAVSGYAIAMGNGADEVKAAAAFVTSGHEEDGFARAVDHLLSLK